MVVGLSTIKLASHIFSQQARIAGVPIDTVDQNCQVGQILLKPGMIPLRVLEEFRQIERLPFGQRLDGILFLENNFINHVAVKVFPFG